MLHIPGWSGDYIFGRIPFHLQFHFNHCLKEQLHHQNHRTNSIIFQTPTTVLRNHFITRILKQKNFNNSVIFQTWHNCIAQRDIEFCFFALYSVLLPSLHHCVLSLIARKEITQHRQEYSKLKKRF